MPLLTLPEIGSGNSALTRKIESDLGAASGIASCHYSATMAKTDRLGNRQVQSAPS